MLETIENFKHLSNTGVFKVQILLLTYLVSVGQPSFRFTIENVSTGYCYEQASIVKHAKNTYNKFYSSSSSTKFYCL